MNIHILENMMYQMSDFFLAPVLILLVILFGYSLVALGGFAYQALQRSQSLAIFQQLQDDFSSLTADSTIKGYPLIGLFVDSLQRSRVGQTRVLTKDHFDVAALKELEGVRSVSRLAPMLGLIATMVPMGPALKSLADGNVQGISENLIVAFSAVVFGLVIASVTFWIASVKKRWLASELLEIQTYLAVQERERLNKYPTIEGVVREAA